MAGKAGADIFGTFLKNVTPEPSTSSTDLSRLTQSVVEWAGRQQGTRVTEASPASSPGVIARLAQAIADAGSSVSVIALVEATHLDVDTVASALRDATATGLLRVEERPEGTRLFDLTPEGHQLLART